MLSTIDRYLLKEVALTASATVIVLLAMVLSYRLARSLSQAASGLLAQDAIWTLLGLQAIRYLVILIPLAMLLAIMLALGRLYQDSEITALRACGLGPLAIYRPLLLLTLPLAVLMTVLTMALVPQSLKLYNELLDQARKDAELSVFSPGTFRQIAGGAHVIYIGSISDGGRQINDIFVYSRTHDGFAITTADRGRQRIDSASGVRFIVLEDGYRYQGRIGYGAYDIVSYQRLTIRADSAPVENARQYRETLSTRNLLASDNPRLRAELHERISGPISLLLITLLAPLLAHASPREGRYGRVVAALLMYAIYVNLIGIGQAWIERDTGWGQLGLWWVHGLMIVLITTLWLYHYPPRRQPRLRAHKYMA